MMKKVLLFAVTAILLGTVTMVAPLMLLKPDYYKSITSPKEGVPQGSPDFLNTLGEGERTFENGEPLERAVSPSSLSSAALMLVPSFLLALGVSLYLKKRML